MTMLKKIESLFFYLFIFCIPLQTKATLVNWAPARIGFNEWTSALLQVTDILILLMLLFWMIRWVKGDARLKVTKADIFLGVFFLVSALSITASNFKSLSGYQLIKLAEFITFYFYIKSNIGRVFQWEKLLEVIMISGAVQAVIGIVQYTTQSALGLRFLSESPITPGGEGVASFYVGTKVYLRAYGLMPHPNILAMFLMLAIFAFYYLYFNSKLRFGRTPYYLAIYALMLYALFATYSRTVIGLMVLAMVVFLVIQVWQNPSTSSGQARRFKILLNKKVYTIMIVSVAVILLFLSLNFHQAVSRALISGSDEAVSLRIFYGKVAGQTTGHYPWLGIGIGAFVPKLMQVLSKISSYYYQPVHNIYLLISSETGILGIASFLAFLFLLVKNYIRKNNLSDPNKLGFLLVCLTLLAIGLFDHLLWTIQQGRIVFWLVLALL